MDIHEVQRVLNVTKQTIYQHIQRGNLNPVKRDSEWFFNGSEVYRFMLKRMISKDRYSPTNPPPEIIADKREYSARHILSLIAMLRRFELRYEMQERYMQLFEFEKLLTSIFIDFVDPEQIFTGRLINEVLDYLESRRETAMFEEEEVWNILYERMKEAFLEPADSFDRRALFEDMLFDVIIELTSAHPHN